MQNSLKFELIKLVKREEEQIKCYFFLVCVQTNLFNDHKLSVFRIEVKTGKKNERSEEITN